MEEVKVKVIVVDNGEIARLVVQQAIVQVEVVVQVEEVVQEEKVVCRILPSKFNRR